MNHVLKVLLLSVVLTVGFASCSKKAQDAETEPTSNTKQAIMEMKATTIDAAKDAVAKTEAAAKGIAAASQEAAGDATDPTVNAVEEAKY